MLLGTPQATATNGAVTFGQIGVSDDGNLTVTATATFNSAPLTAASANLTVANVAPRTLVITAPAPNATFAPGQPVQVTATFDDPGTTDTHVCTITPSGGNAVQGTVAPATGSAQRTCTGSVQLAGTGAGSIQVAVADDDGGSAQAAVAVGAGFPTLSIADATVDEGAVNEQSTLTFTVTLAPAAAQRVTVAYQATEGSASNGSDFASTGGTLTFEPGETTKTIAVAVRGDDAVEPDETVVVTLAAPTGATLGDATATGTITNDDGFIPTTVCSPRPRIILDVERAGGDRLTVTVEADRTGPNAANALESLRFGTPANAAVELPGQAASTTGNLTVPLGNGTTRFTFSIRRLTAGQPAQVPLTVTDSCGAWDTFVGGGVNAF